MKLYSQRLEAILQIRSFNTAVILQEKVICLKAHIFIYDSLLGLDYISISSLERQPVRGYFQYLPNGWLSYQSLSSLSSKKKKRKLSTVLLEPDSLVLFAVHLAMINVIFSTHKRADYDRMWSCTRHVSIYGSRFSQVVALLWQSQIECQDLSHRADPYRLPSCGLFSLAYL